jgi:hypothetical protein
VWLQPGRGTLEQSLSSLAHVTSSDVLLARTCQWHSADLVLQLSKWRHILGTITGTVSPNSRYICYTGASAKMLSCSMHVSHKKRIYSGNVLLESHEGVISSSSSPSDFIFSFIWQYWSLDAGPHKHCTT